MLSFCRSIDITASLGSLNIYARYKSISSNKKRNGKFRKEATKSQAAGLSIKSSILVNYSLRRYDRQLAIRHVPSAVVSLRAVIVIVLKTP